MLRPYRPSDWQLINDSLQAEFAPFREEHCVMDVEHAATYEMDGIPVAAGGVATYWPGVGMAWIIANERMREHPFRFGRAIKTIFDYQIKPAFWRIEAVVKLDRHDIHRMMTHLDFRPECIAKYYGPDRSHFMKYVWVRE